MPEVEKKEDSTKESETDSAFGALSNNSTALMTANLCIKHFPEPIIYISDEPMCKKCIPEYLEKMKKNKKVDEEETN